MPSTRTLNFDWSHLCHVTKEEHLHPAESVASGKSSSAESKWCVRIKGIKMSYIALKPVQRKIAIFHVEDTFNYPPINLFK